MLAPACVWEGIAGILCVISVLEKLSPSFTQSEQQRDTWVAFTGMTSCGLWAAICGKPSILMFSAKEIESLRPQRPDGCPWAVGCPILGF